MELRRIIRQVIFALLRRRVDKRQGSGLREAQPPQYLCEVCLQALKADNVVNLTMGQATPVVVRQFIVPLEKGRKVRLGSLEPLVPSDGFIAYPATVPQALLRLCEVLTVVVLEPEVMGDGLIERVADAGENKVCFLLSGGDSPELRISGMLVKDFDAVIVFAQFSGNGG